MCGVVKDAQLGFYGPALNWFACRVANDPGSQLASWPLKTMDLLPDQLLVTRLLTAGRGKGSRWQRTCLVLRPFHAITRFALDYSTAEHPADIIIRTANDRLTRGDALDRNDAAYWATFQGANDRYVRMLRGVQYGSAFVAAVPRLDGDNQLPRMEILVPTATIETGEDPWPFVLRGMERVVTALDQTGFDVAAEHNMFSTEPKLDVLPRLIIKAHDTVKIWAAELLGRVQEYVGYHLAQYMKGKRARGIQVRPFNRHELEALYTQLRTERERMAGARRTAS